MKVLHVVPWYEPAWTTGGTAVAVSTLCRALAAQGVDVTVYTTNDKGGGQYLDIPLNQPVHLGGVKVWYFRCGFLKDWKAAIYSKDLTRKLKSSITDFDLVHVASTRHWHGREVCKLSKSTGIPYIIAPHASLMDWWIKRIGNKYFKLLYMYLIDSKVIKCAAAVHYLSEGERLLSKKYDHARPSFIVPNGIMLDEFKRNMDVRNRLRIKYDLSDNSLLLLQLGRIHPQKNIHLLIDALDKLNAKSKKNIILFIVGPISDRKYYQYLQTLINRYGLNSNIRFFPPVNRQEVSNWYSIADLMVVSSEVEGISMSIIEALAASLPVLISNRVANFSEIEDDKAGLVVDPTAESIASVLMTVISNPHMLTHLSENTKKCADKRYSISAASSLMVKAYENILSGIRDTELQWS